MTKLLVPGDKAPQIQGQAVQRGDIVDFTLDDALKGAEFMLLVFYPADFTFVCPTEIVQFMEKNSEFVKHKCSVVCCSTDSVYTHLAWLKAPKSERGLGASNSDAIVLLSDRSHEISCAYGVLASNGAAYRGTFLIDRTKTICQVTINDMPVGRSVEDALRMLAELRGCATDSVNSDLVSSSQQQSNSSNASLDSELHHPRELLHGQQQPEHHRIKVLRPLTGIPIGTPWEGGCCLDDDNDQCRNQDQGTYQQLPSATSPTVSSELKSHSHTPQRGGLIANAGEPGTRVAQLRWRDSEAQRTWALAGLRATVAEKVRSETTGSNAGCNAATNPL